MRLLLIGDVEGLGRKGDVVEVADGYGRNFLLPKKLATQANPGSVRNAERMRQAREEADRHAMEEAEDLARVLSGTHIVIAARTGDEGRLFGSIGPTDVVEGVRKFTGIELDRKRVLLDEPIRSIGLHGARVRLHPEVEVMLVLDVIPA